MSKYELPPEMVEKLGEVVRTTSLQHPFTNWENTNYDLKEKYKKVARAVVQEFMEIIDGTS